ncbi:hypothetical protein C3V44_07400 [Capnocytophaga sp. oral taxon 864]|nr:hypothetical protein C3V44_07400 [Capnocytophaga sp. oral taxon 864]
MRCDIKTACSNVGSFLFERFLRGSEVRGRNTATVARQATVARRAIIARQARKKLANREALRGSEDIGEIRKRGGRVFGEKRA